MMTVAPIVTAADFFAAKLNYETDPSDLAAIRATRADLIVIDTRSSAGWVQGRIPGALHIPGSELADLAPSMLPDRDADIGVYCWGPGCNGSTKAAFTLASLGYRRVRELIGGFEYWAREGLAIETDDGRRRRPVDELTAPVPSTV
jgi:rhodanese-related sulfurtransferase